MQGLFTMKYIELIHQSQLNLLFSEFSTLYDLFLPIWPSLVAHSIYKILGIKLAT